MITITAITIKTSILLSNLRCIKMLRTNEDLIAAISNAMATVNAPREICVRVTETSVRTINVASTYRKVLYGII
jgi:hypothetical protein